MMRARNSHEPGLMNAIIWRGLTDPIFYVMERRMLIGLCDWAEALTPVPQLV